MNLTPPSFDAINPNLKLKTKKKLNPTPTPKPTPKTEIDTESPTISPEPVIRYISEEESETDIVRINQLREKLKKYPLVIVKLVTNCIVEDKLDKSELFDLTELILNDAPLAKVKQYLEEHLGIDLGVINTEEKKKIRLVVSNENYTVEKLTEKRERLRYLKYSSIIITAILFFLTSVYLMVVKPIIYKKIIASGKEDLLANYPSVPNQKVIKEAEALFKKALFFYPEDTYAYIQYADAYKRLGLYDIAFKKLFGDVILKSTTSYEGRTLVSSYDIWNILKGVPIVKYKNELKNELYINNTVWDIKEKGAYLISHLLDKDEAVVMLALGQFHSNPVQKFKISAYRNNLLGIDYFKRILTFKSKTPFLKKDFFTAQALLNIGNIFYEQKDYYKAIEYYSKIINTFPDFTEGHAAIMRAILKIYKSDKDPRMAIDYHNKIKYQYKVEKMLPLYIQAKLAEFYIDLPSDTDLRIYYNLSPKDHIANKELRNRSYELLNMLFHSQETDIYGNHRKGSDYAAGYYEFSRYYRKVVNQDKMALKQLEYVYKYAPNHFLALNDRGEILIDLKDYTSAIEYLKLAIDQITPENIALLGLYPEDELLLEADIGKIYFNLGKAYYLSTVQQLDSDESWRRMQEVDRYKSNYDSGLSELSSSLDKIDLYFEKAVQTGVISKEAEAELLYYQGWSYYVRGNYRKALLYWEEIPSEWKYKVKNLEIGLSNTLYRLATDLSDENTMSEKKKFLQSSLGNLLFLQEYYHNYSKGIQLNKSSEHIHIFKLLSTIENNLGAVYEVFNDEERSILHYWKSIEYSKSLGYENEIARYNLNLSFKRSKLLPEERYPLIMDYINPYFQPAYK